MTTPKPAIFSFDFNRACPSVAPINGPFAFDGDVFTEQELAIAGEAIDAGIFNQRAFADFCRDKWVQGHPATESCITGGQDDVSERMTGTWDTDRKRRDAVRQVVRNSPRGTWAVLRTDWDNGERTGVRWEVFFARGNARVLEPHMGLAGRRAPNFDDVIHNVVNYEIYLARRAEEARRERARSRATLASYDWGVGSVIKRVRLGSHAFSAVRIVDVMDSGYIKVHCTKRGSGRRWEATVLAQALRLEDGQQHEPAYGQLTVTEHD